MQWLNENHVLAPNVYIYKSLCIGLYSKRDFFTFTILWYRRNSARHQIVPHCVIARERSHCWDQQRRDSRSIKRGEHSSEIAVGWQQNLHVDVLAVASFTTCYWKTWIAIVLCLIYLGSAWIAPIYIYQDPTRTMVEFGLLINAASRQTVPLPVNVLAIIGGYIYGKNAGLKIIYRKRYLKTNFKRTTLWTLLA